MPGIERMSLDFLLEEAAFLHRQGIQAIALFPSIAKEKKTEKGEEAWNPYGLIPHAIRAVKQSLPQLCVIADVALDPYTSHGHDGIVNDRGEILNDETVELLCRMALVQAEAGAEYVAPSDMMDGRVKELRMALDLAGFSATGILSYSIKYASSLYAPFRDALHSQLAFGDKKTYQMDPANSREALLEAKLDEEEGADILMIKPATFYLDIIAKLRAQTNRPIAAYHVSGEYAMIMAAAKLGYLNHAERVLYEALLSIKRAGADLIFTYGVRNILSLL
jgi:porphobilinogen synthase